MKKQISNCCNADVWEKKTNYKDVTITCCTKCNNSCQTDTEEDMIEEIGSFAISNGGDYIDIILANKINEIIKHINKKK